MYFTDTQLQQLQSNPEFRQYGSTCPVCRGMGVYRFLGQEYQCPDDDYGHIMLRRAMLYWLANIGLQYQTLDWTKWHHEEVKPDIEKYIEMYEYIRYTGAGITFFSKGLGTGKTWAATHVLKELLKKGTDGYFIPFYQIKDYEDPDWQERMQRVRNAELLVLDEVRRPSSEAERTFFSNHLENLIRPRTNANFPTIITTNMSPDELEHDFPRVFSLLMAKNDVFDLDGVKDARIEGSVFRENLELAMNGEMRPIT